MLYGDGLSFNNLLQNVKPGTFLITLGVFAILVAVASVTLIYHWQKYRLHSPLADKAHKVYLAGTFILFGLATIFLLAYLS